ncbi:uncharacterized protein [Cherax quadricarinatus]
MLKWLCCGKDNSCCYNDLSEEEILREEGTLPRPLVSGEARNDVPTCQEFQHGVPAVDTLEDPEKETPKAIVKVSQIQLGTSSTAGHSKNLNEFENCKNSQDQSYDTVSETLADLSHSEVSSSPTQKTTANTNLVETRPHQPYHGLLPCKQNIVNIMTFNSEDEKASEEVQNIDKEKLPPYKKVQGGNVEVMTDCQHEPNLANTNDKNGWVTNLIQNTSKRLDKKDVSNKIYADILPNHSPGKVESNAIDLSSFPEVDIDCQDISKILCKTVEISNHFICQGLSCLYNHMGYLCKLSGKLYILTTVLKTQVLVNTAVQVSDGMRVGCRLVWKGTVPIPIFELPDHACVQFDAVVLPNTKAFHTIVIWQEEKPDFVTEPLNDSYIFIESRELPVLRFVHEKTTSYIEVKFDDKLVKSEFCKDLIFVDEKPASISDMSVFKGTVFARVCKMMGCDAVGTLSYMCYCIWSGKRPPRDFSHMVFKKGEAYKREPSGKYIQKSEFQRLWCDIPSQLKINNLEFYLMLCVKEMRLSINVAKEKLCCQSFKITSDSTLNISVKTHIMEIVNRDDKSWEILLVQLPHSENGQLTEVFSACTPTTKALASFAQESPLANNESALQKGKSTFSLPVPHKNLNTILGNPQREERQAASRDVVQATSASDSSSLSSQPYEGGNCSMKTHKNTSDTDTIEVEECVWHFGSISQGVITHFNKTILIRHDSFFVDGVRALSSDPLAKFCSKIVLVNAVIKPLPVPITVLGCTVTHKALVAWQGNKPFENIHSKALPDLRYIDHNIPVTKNFTIQKDSLFFTNAACKEPNRPRTERGFNNNAPPHRHVSYIGSCTWKLATISLGIVANSTSVIVINHNKFFVAQKKVSATDPLVKFKGNCKLVNVEAAVLYPARTVLGQTASHEAVVAWHGKKPPEAQAIVNEYLLGKPTNNKYNNIQICVTKSDRYFLLKGNERSSIPMCFPHAQLCKSFNSHFIADVSGKLIEVGEDYGILRIRGNFTEKEALVVIHRSVIYIDKKKVLSDRPLDQQIKISGPKQFHCSVMKHVTKIGNTNIQYKATLVWQGKKPTKDDICLQNSSKFLPTTTKTDLEGRRSTTSSSFLPESTGNESSSSTNISSSSESLVTLHTTASTDMGHSVYTLLDETEDDGILTDAQVTELQKMMGRLQVRGGELYYFNCKHSFLFGIRLHQVELCQVLHVGMNVKCRLKKHNDQLWAIEGVWIGGKKPQDPCAGYALLLQWCHKHNVPDDAVDSLLHEAGYIADDPSAAAVVGSASSTVKEYGEGFSSSHCLSSVSFAVETNLVHSNGVDWMSPDLFPIAAAGEERDIVQLNGTDWMSPDLFPVAAAGDERDIVQLNE